MLAKQRSSKSSEAVERKMREFLSVPMCSYVFLSVTFEIGCGGGPHRSTHSMRASG